MGSTARNTYRLDSARTAMGQATAIVSKSTNSFLRRVISSSVRNGTVRVLGAAWEMGTTLPGPRGSPAFCWLLMLFLPLYRPCVCELSHERQRVLTRFELVVKLK